MEEDLKTGEGTEAVKPLGLEPPEEKEGEKKKVDWRLIAGGLGIVVLPGVSRLKGVRPTAAPVRFLRIMPSE